MKIKFSKNQLRIKLAFGLFWLIFALVQIFIINKENSSWIKYAWTSIAAIYLGQFTYQYIYQYLTIKDGYIKRNNLFGKKLMLADIIQIRKFAKKYTLKTKSDELVIHLDLIDPISLIELNAEMRKYNIDWS